MTAIGARVPAGTVADGGYLLGGSDGETARLIRQAGAFRAITKRLLVEAGLRPGMRVLDLGSGAGDVAFLAAELVGRGGSVVGIDRDPKVLAVARARARADRLTNAAFLQGELDAVRPAGRFDAVIGRFILVYQDDPAALLRSYVAHLRPRAVVAFLEADFHHPIAVPMGPVLAQAVEWWLTTLQRAGVEDRMGPKLHATMIAAGLPAPAMFAETLIGDPRTSPVPMILAQVLRSVLPVMLRLGIVTEDELGIETLEERIRAEAIAGGGIIAAPMMIGAWTRVPQAV